MIDQIVGTAFLVMFVVAVIDARNTAVQANLGPWLIGLVVAAIGLSYGANAGYAINPARDFGPRLFAYFAGWGDVALPGTVPGAFSTYFWIPIVGPLIGGVLGVLIYDAAIGTVLHARAGREEPPGRTQEPVAASDTVTLTATGPAGSGAGCRACGARRRSPCRFPEHRDELFIDHRVQRDA